MYGDINNEYIDHSEKIEEIVRRERRRDKYVLQRKMYRHKHNDGNIEMYDGYRSPYKKFRSPTTCKKCGAIFTPEIMSGQELEEAFIKLESAYYQIRLLSDNYDDILTEERMVSLCKLKDDIIDSYTELISELQSTKKV